jgi:hypothetical protein
MELCGAAPLTLPRVCGQCRKKTEALGKNWAGVTTGVCPWIDYATTVYCPGIERPEAQAPEGVLGKVKALFGLLRKG